MLTGPSTQKIWCAPACSSLASLHFGAPAPPVVVIHRPRFEFVLVELRGRSKLVRCHVFDEIVREAATKVGDDLRSPRTTTGQRPCIGQLAGVSRPASAGSFARPLAAGTPGPRGWSRVGLRSPRGSVWESCRLVDYVIDRPGRAPLVLVVADRAPDRDFAPASESHADLEQLVARVNDYAGIVRAEAAAHRQQ